LAPELATVLVLLAADDLTLVPRSLGIAGADQLARGLRATDIWTATWRMTLSPSKSHIVIFGRNGRPRTLRLDFYLRGQLLPTVSEVKYLGVWLDSTLSFKKQLSEKVLQAKRLAGLIVKRVGRAVAGRCIPLKVSRALTCSLLMPTVLYGSEFWLVGNRRAQKQLDCQFARVLNLTLRLRGRTLPARAIMAECRVPSARIAAEQRLLSLSSRIMLCPTATAARALLQLQFDMDIPRPANVLHFGTQASAAAARWGLNLPADKLTLRSSKQDIMSRDWQARGEHALLRSLTVDPETTSYLYADYPDVSVRANLRFGCAPTARRRHRFDPAVSPQCSFCGAHEQSVPHLLMACQRFYRRRMQLSESLAARGVDLSLAILLGDTHRIRRSLRSWALQHTFPFVHLVYQSLNVP